MSARLGYAYIDGDDVASMIAATANSNFTGEAVTDINVPGASTSNWVVPQRVTLSLFYENEFFGNARTRFSLQGFWNEGQAQSYVMDSSQLEGDGFNGRHLLYVPDGPNDPNVVYDWDDPAMMQEFFDFIERENLKPGFSKRNAHHTGWSNVWHLTIRQEVPLGETLWGNVYFKVKNLGNLLNDDWGKITDAQFFPPEVLRDVNLTPTGQFEYEEFDDQSLQRTYVNPSLWEIRFGIDIRFGT